MVIIQRHKNDELWDVILNPGMVILADAYVEQKTTTIKS